jgi:hypothetical protein
VIAIYVWFHDAGGFWPAAPFLADEPLDLWRLYAAYCRAVPGSVPTGGGHGRALAPVDFLTWLEQQRVGRVRSAKRVEFNQSYDATPIGHGEFYELRAQDGVLEVDGVRYAVNPSFEAALDESLSGVAVLRFGFGDAWPSP